SVNTWPASGSPSLRQSGNILLSGTNSHMPAVNTNAAGDISVIYSRNNASTNPEVCQSSRLAVDALGTIGAPQVLATSTGNYGSAGGNRWGDYFGCEIDPVDNLTFWGIGMAAGAGGQWQTHINKWTVSSGAGATLVSPVAIATTQGNFVVGDLAAVTNSDNNRYSIQSVLIDKFGVPTSNANLATAMVATAQVDFDLDMSQGTLDDLKVSVETNVSKVGASGQVFAYNWFSGTYVSIASFAISTSDKKALISVKKTQLSSFVDGTGNMRLLIRSISSVKAGRPGVLPPPFQFNIDQIGLSPSFTG
ncbi:MAG: hypothetical protein IT203_05755, partial [Fimbriimonadaceae bacterium]|nr:hypothetical protein [Fimbriimonadaceae bacterium]